MRKDLLVAAIVFSLIAPVVANQQAPPQTPPATPGRPGTTTPPATAPSAPTPPNVRPPSTTPPRIPTPTGPRVPSVTPPSVGFGPTQAPPPDGQTPRPGGAPGGPTTRPGAPGAIPPSAQSTSWQNVRLEVTISDSLNVDTQIKRTVSMLILDGRNGQVRSTSDGGLINIDANPTVQRDGRIYLRLTVEYRPELSASQAQQTGTSRTSQFNESLALIVSDGKPIVASQSADPRSERKVSLEVTATVLK